jgi:hypothetical protein
MTPETKINTAAAIPQTAASAYVRAFITTLLRQNERRMLEFDVMCRRAPQRRAAAK